MAEYQLKWSTGRLGLERKCVTKNDEKNDKKCEISASLKSDPKPIFTSKIINFRRKSEVFQTNSSRSRASVGGVLGDTKGDLSLGMGCDRIARVLVVCSCCK